MAFTDILFIQALESIISAERARTMLCWGGRLGQAQRISVSAEARFWSGRYVWASIVALFREYNLQRRQNMHEDVTCKKKR